VKVTHSYYTPLHFGAIHGRSDIAEILIRNGADIMASIEYGSPLKRAAQSGHAEIIEILCNAGACTDTTELNTSLVIAATGNHTDAVKTLIKFGADVNNESVGGARLLSLRFVNQHKDIVEILKNAGAKE
jgi:ankyrin repeat protein